MTAISGDDGASIFVTNVLNGTVSNSPSTVNMGTVVRLDVHLAEGDMPRRVNQR
jgi:hypothetical protein